MLVYRVIATGEWVNEIQVNDVPVENIVSQFGGVASDYESFPVPKEQELEMIRGNIKLLKYENGKFIISRGLVTNKMSVDVTLTSDGSEPERIKCNHLGDMYRLITGSEYTIKVTERLGPSNSQANTSTGFRFYFCCPVNIGQTMPSALVAGEASFNFTPPVGYHGVADFMVEPTDHEYPAAVYHGALLFDNT